MLIVSASLCGGSEQDRFPALPVEELELDNGLTFLLLHRPEMTSVAAGWVVTVGSANDPAGQAGVSHLLEHVLFKGSRVIGAKNLDRELELLVALDESRAHIVELERQLERSSERKSEKLNRRLADLENEFRRIQEEAAASTFLGYFSFLYSEFGGTGLNANTFPDMTTYFVTVPANRLEGWFWLESDRLLQPVFRELYKEIEIVHEERNIRIESTPTGALDAQVRRLFWGDHPYAVGPQGTEEQVDRLSRPIARRFFRDHYRPDRITAVLVGGFDPIEVRQWARAYFGRLHNPRSDSVASSEPIESGAVPEQRLFEAECDCSPQAQVHYPSVPFSHADAYALDVLAGVLNGRSGRLHRSLVLDREIAFSAHVEQQRLRRAGRFTFRAETKGDTTPADLVAAWDREVAGIETGELSAEEIERAVNRMSADAFRALKDPVALMSQLLYYQGLGDWRHVHRWARGIHEIGAQDVRAVARRYLVPERRLVALYEREAASPSDPRSTSAQGTPVSAE